ncbi:MAG: hypothetical protein ACRD1Q_06555 [Vicinamibacterales bacterium]
MGPRLFPLWALLVAGTLAVSRCADVPTAPTADPVGHVETFAGTLVQHGMIVHHFTVAEQGNVTITVVSAARIVATPPYESPPDASKPPAAEDGPLNGIPPHTDAPPAAEDKPPTPAVQVGMGIGTWSGSECSLIAQRTDASVSTVMSGTAMAGEFCVSIFDSGSVTDSVDYAVQVDHP